MRINKMICLEEEVALKLKKESNASQLINELLIKHWRENELETLSDEELEIKLAEVRLEKEYKDKLKELKNGIRK